MILSRLTRVLFAGTALATVACGVVADEHVDRAESALEIANSGFIPVPVFPGGRTAWDVTLVDLMAADAWAECGLRSDRRSQDDANEADAYLLHLMSKMQSASCVNSNGVGILFNWFSSRGSHPECNIDPSTHSPMTVTFRIPPSDIYSQGFNAPPATDNQTSLLA